MKRESNVFQGASTLILGTKGRVSIPSQHREVLQLQTEGRVTVTKHPDGCLILFPRPEWERFRERIAALPMEAHWWRQIFLGSAAGIELDTTGRVLITPKLHAAASLERDVMLLSIGSHFEVWDTAAYTTKEQATMVRGMPGVLGNFSF